MANVGAGSVERKRPYKFETLVVSEPEQYVFHVELNRPAKRNSLNPVIWRELQACFEQLADDPDCRVVVLSGRGKVFCAGFDFGGMRNLAASSKQDLDVARKAWNIRRTGLRSQAMFTAIEKCPKPVIAAVHGAAYGAGVGLNSASDIRFCTTDAIFSIKEVDVGLVEDVGTLQRLPKKTGNDSLLRELAFTARPFTAAEAAKIGMTSRQFTSKEEMMEAAMALGREIASKSPVAVQGSKIAANFARDHPVDEALDYVTSWNMFQMQSEDTVKAALATAARQKDPPHFSKL